MIANLKKLTTSSFMKGVIALTTGTTIAQVVPVLLTPLLTRLYTPEDFGFFTLYNSLFGMVFLYAAGRYEQAIMLPKNNNDAVNIMGLAFVILTVLVLTAEGLIIGLGNYLAQIFTNQVILMWLPWVPLSIFLMAGYQILFVWFNRQRKIKILTLSKIVNVLSLITTQVILGINNFSVGLIYGLIAGQFAGFIFLLYHLFNYHSEELKFDWEVMKRNAKEYKEFPLINSFQSFFDTLHQHGIILVMSTFYPTAVLGSIGMARRAVGSPAALIGKSFAHNTYERAAKYKNQGIPLTPFLKKVLLILAGIAAPIFGILFFIADEVFPWLLGGGKWGQAGEFVQILVPYLMFSFLSSPIAVVPLVMKQQGFFLKVSSIGNLMALGIFATLSWMGLSVYSSLSFYSFFMGIYSLIYIWLVLKKAS